MTMSNEPLAQLNDLQGSRDEADYDAALAAATATARGRWFLAEYARRNCHPDTERIVSAVSRIEVAIRGESPLQRDAPARRELIEIAAALARIAAAMGAGTGANALPALERMADIAFVLHERPVEPSLCDALDAALREISDACAAADGTNAARALLQALAGRVDAMLAAADGAAAPAVASAATAAAAIEPDAEPSAPQFEGVEVVSFTRTVTVLTQAMPAEAAPELAMPPEAMEPQRGGRSRPDGGGGGDRTGAGARERRRRLVGVARRRRIRQCAACCFGVSRLLRRGGRNRHS